METQNSKYRDLEEKEQHTTATFIHLSTFLKYVFPLSNFIVPLIIWTYNKEKRFIDEHGRQAINFQLSMLLYTLIILMVCIPFILIFAIDFFTLIDGIDRAGGEFTTNNIQNISGYAILFGVLILIGVAKFLFELYAVINAAIHASRGQLYRYPLSIGFIKTNKNIS